MDESTAVVDEGGVGNRNGVVMMGGQGKRGERHKRGRRRGIESNASEVYFPHAIFFS